MGGAAVVQRIVPALVITHATQAPLFLASLMAKKPAPEWKSSFISWCTSFPTPPSEVSLSLSPPSLLA